MKITSVERSKKNRGRMSVYTDGSFAFSISEEDYLSMHLYDRDELSTEEIDYIKNTLNFNAAKSTAVKFISLRLRTEKEIRLKLHDAEFDKDVVERAIEELKSIGYINNKLYAQKYIYDRSKLKPKSKKLLRMELQSKGIPDDVADEALDDWNVDEPGIAEALVRRKFGKYNLKDEVIIRKAYMFLSHRGYSNDVIEEVVSRINSNDR